MRSWWWTTARPTAPRRSPRAWRARSHICGCCPARPPPHTPPRGGAAPPHRRLPRPARTGGSGAALRTGFAATPREWILLLDADGQFLPAELERLVAAAPGADLVLGYRHRRADSAHRRFFAAVWRLLVGLLLGVRVRDTNCGFKLMRTALVQSLDLQAGGALISAELLAKARRRGAVLVEVPVTHVPRRWGRQTGGSLPVTLRAYFELARLGWRIRRFRG